MRPDLIRPDRSINRFRADTKFEWPLVEMNDVVTLNYGKALKEGDRSPGPIPVYGTNGRTGWHDTPLGPGPTVILGRKGMGNLGVEWCEGPFWVIDTAYYVSFRNDVFPRFFYYFTNYVGLNHLKDGTSNPSLSRDTFGRQWFPLPPIDEQKKIAGFLAALDNKIELNRRMNETLEATTRALFKDWFVDFGPTRTKTDSGSAYLAADVWGLFPEAFDGEGKPQGWESSEIGKEARCVGGSTPSTGDSNLWNGGQYWATPKDLSLLRSPVLLSTERTISRKGLEKISSGLLPVGTVLLSSRAPIGYLAIAEVPTAINQGFIALLPEGRLSSVFIWQWVIANMDAILQKANGSTFQEISKSNFRPLRVVVPPAPLLKRFDEIARPLYERIRCNEVETRSLAALRDLILPKLMSGEMHLRDTDKQIEEAL